jgi:hypothetical protein
MTPSELLATISVTLAILLNIITLIVFITKLGARLESLTTAVTELSKSLHATSSVVQNHEVRISVIEAKGDER